MTNEKDGLIAAAVVLGTLWALNQIPESTAQSSQNVNEQNAPKTESGPITEIQIGNTGVTVTVTSEATNTPLISSVDEKKIQSVICSNTASGNLDCNDQIINDLSSVIQSIPNTQPLFPVGTGVGAQTASVTTYQVECYATCTIKTVTNVVSGTVTPETAAQYLSSAEQIQAQGGYLSAYDISILKAAGLYTGSS